MSLLPDRDPTPGELRIMFENIMAALRDVKDTMATKEFVNAKFDSHNERMSRLEEDVKGWVLESTKLIANLKSDMVERIREVEKDSDLEHKELNERISAIITEKTEAERSKKTRTIAVTLALIGAGLSLIVSIVQQIIISRLLP